VTGHRLGWLAMAVVAVAALLIGVSGDRDPSTPGERAHRLAESVQCPVCSGQSVADSDVSASRFIREQIDDRIAAGASDDEIRDELAASYGEDILLTPERSGLAGLVWVLPVAVLVVALGGIALAFRRWRHRDVGGVSEADRALVERALEDMRAAP
jgi:cytochrome c-type biogenesis protein CcmH